MWRLCRRHPADPHLHFNVNQSNCKWNGFDTDANGDSYNPDEKNIMSYTDVNCMKYFTPKQGERMRNAISTLPYLQQTITNCTNCNEKPKIDIELEPIGANYVSVHMVGVDGTDINSQCIESTSWEILSNNGACYASFGGRNFEALGHGNCTNWNIYAKITATNPYGTTTIYRTITPPIPISEPCDDLFRIGRDSYNHNTYRIIEEPCNDYRNFSSNNSNLNRKIKIYDLNGNLVFETTKLEFDISSLRKGIYIIKAYINKKVITHKIIK